MGSDALTALEQALSTVVRNANVWRLHDLITEEAGVELDRAAYGVLAALEGDPGVRLSALADRLGIDISTASRHVHSLQEKELVRRATDPADRRAANLSLTEAGREVLTKVHTARCRLIERVVEDWDAAEVDQLATLMERLGRGIASIVSGDAASIRG